jgi:hypothetical protein
MAPAADEGTDGGEGGAAGGNRRPSGPTVPRRLPRAVSGGEGGAAAGGEGGGIMEPAGADGMPGLTTVGAGDFAAAVLS